MTAIIDTAKTLLARALNVAGADIADHTSPATLAAWDSIGHMRLVLELEAVMKRDLSGDEIAGLMSLADVETLMAHADRT
jgi:acyl carrier protein